MENNVTLEGNLTQDPKTGSGKYGLWALFTLASTSYFDKQEYTQFVPCSASKKTAEIIANFKKGDRLLVFGKVKGRYDKDEKKSDVKVDIKRVHIISRSSSEARQSPVSEKGEQNVSKDLPF